MTMFEGIAKGDRVRVTFEGVAQPSDFTDDLNVKIDGSSALYSFNAAQTGRPSFLIEKTQRPIEVGMAVKMRGERGAPFKVEAVCGGMAWLWRDGLYGTTESVDLLEAVQ